MKENCLKRLLSFALVIAMVVSLCPTIAFAGDTPPYRGESALADNEPTSHGYRAEDLLSWDPATDRTQSFCGRGYPCRTAFLRLQPPGQPQPEP